MLTEERFSIIIDTVNREKSVGINRLCELLGASVSTVRRDLNTLDEMGKIVKVHGGAVTVNGDLPQLESNRAKHRGKSRDVSRGKNGNRSLCFAAY